MIVGYNWSVGCEDMVGWYGEMVLWEGMRVQYNGMMGRLYVKLR